MYIGQTCQTPETRWAKGNGYVRHRYFYNAIKKYGWDGFYHDIIISNLTKENADNLEKILIFELDTMNPSKGYNSREGGSHGRPSMETRKRMGESLRGRKMSEEAKEKIRLANIGKKHTEESKQKQRELMVGRMVGADNPAAKKVVQLDKNGNEIKIWDCMSTAARELNISISNITACCRGRLNSTGGFVWRYFDEQEK